MSALRVLAFALVLLAFAAPGARDAAAQERVGTVSTLEEVEDLLPGLPSEPSLAARAWSSRGKVLDEAPFGAQLFTSRAPQTSGAANPDHRVEIGDQIAIRLWGATSMDEVVRVDPQGNVFIPEVGPIGVRGVRSGDLDTFVRDAVEQVFVDNVEVYATLLAPSAIGVFVTGFVEAPGRYLGSASESAVDFLQRARGVDPTRGSYRDIRVSRGGREIARVDLYRFLLDGVLPDAQLRDGDVILVGAQLPTVFVEGEVRNVNRFEFPVDAGLSGTDVLALARPLPAASAVLVSGIRGGEPVSRYVDLDTLRTLSFVDQDRITFVEDGDRRSVTVAVEGAQLGRSIFVADNDRRLSTLLDYVAVDPELADLGAIHLRRVRVAEQQRQSLDDALNRLERALLTASSRTSGEAQLRKTEADLVSRFIERARLIEPSGVVVLSRPDGTRADVRLEEGDVVVVPEKSEVVIVTGEVIAPQAMVFDDSLSPTDYVERAGGYTQRGDHSQFIVRKPNGQVVVSGDPEIGPGDEIVIPPDIEFKGLQLASDLLTIVFQIAVIAGVLL